MNWGALRHLGIGVLVVLLAACGGGSDGSGGGEGGSSSSGSSSSSGGDTGSAYNSYLPVSEDISLFYNSSDIASIFDGTVEHKGQTASALTYMNGHRHYLSSRPEAIFLLGYLSPSMQLSELGNFSVEAKLDESALIWGEGWGNTLQPGYGESVPVMGTATISPAYGEKELEFTRRFEYLGRESVETPYGQMDAQSIFVSLAASVDLEGRGYDLYWEATFWLVGGLGIARLEENGEVLLLTALKGPDRDADGVPDLIDAFPDDTTRTFDTDADGMANENDPDDDGDGVGDSLDAFPLDALEQWDTDGDGIGDRADEDDDGDSVADGGDAFPRDAFCWLPQHTDTDGNCELNPGAPERAPSRIFADADGVIYLLDRDSLVLHRWSSAEERFLSPVHGTEPGAALTAAVYHESHNRLYLGYDNGNINYIAPSESMQERRFTSLFQEVEERVLQTQAVQSLVPAGNFLFVQAKNNRYSGYVDMTYSRGGEQLDSNDWRGYYSTEFAWNQQLSRLYQFRDHTSPNDLLYRDIDQASGELLAYGDSPYHGDYVIDGPIRVSPERGLVALGVGDLYQADDLTWSGSVGRFDDALWLENGELLLAIQDGTGFRLERRAEELLSKLEVLEYPGTVLAVIRAGGRNVVISRNGQELRFEEYVPKEDSDGDGVANVEDAFPLDPAASLDSDNDGYPDAWNPGYNESDSTSSLTLDAFPEDSACWLASHEGAADQCDYAATMPRFTPDRVVADDAGTVYLFSEEHSKVFRWSAESGGYINPIYVGLSDSLSSVAPRVMAYSEAHGRLYFGYESGDITYVGLSGDFAEASFTQLSMSVNGLASVGNYLLAQDNSGAWESHHIFNSQGEMVASEDWNHYSREYAWNPSNSRVYFFRDTSSPNDLHYEEIDQASGQIVASGETPYHGGYGMAPPIRVSSSSSMVALGAGDIYDADTLTWLGSVGAFEDALWLDSGDLVTVVQQTPERYRLERRSARLVQVVETLDLPGAILAVRQAGSHIVLVSEVDGELRFTLYIPSNDSDGDGVENLEDAFPLDPAASQDSDNDGYPDAWNPGYGESDSNSGLTLDGFPEDSACWLPEHGDGTGLCDYAATMPVFTPDKVFTDNSGTVYLYSAEHNTVYRWAVNTRKYINPIHVGRDYGLTVNSPTHIEYSEAHQRLYLGYDTGEITYIDLTGSLVEASFARLASAIRGLAVAGEYVLSMGNSGYWLMHYVIDEQGTVVHTDDWGRPLEAYDWSEVDSRVYYFDTLYSTNRIYYKGVSQSTGEVTEASDLYFYGGSRLRQPIRVSHDGMTLVNGSGDFFDAGSLQWSGRVEAFTDAIWLDNGELVTVAQNSTEQGGGYRLQRLSGGLKTVLEVADFEGEILRFLHTAGTNILVSRKDGELVFSDYLPDNDIDGDGIANTVDRFPEDAAASADTDNDGFPDEWNSGFDEMDSTSGLSLDAFPNDSACWLVEHSDGAGSCDYSASLPEFTPAEVVAGDGIFYLYSPENRAVYRWSVNTGAYLNPIRLRNFYGISGASPLHMVYSEEHSRLYFGYEDGRLTYIDLASSSSDETFFGTAWGRIENLAPAGNYLVVQVVAERRTLYTYDAEGVVIDSINGGERYDNSYAWDSSSSRIYQLNYRANNLIATEIDQVSGEIGAVSYLNNNTGSTLDSPIRLSLDNSRILVGTGGLFDGRDFGWLGSVGAFDDALWMGDGELVLAVGIENGFRLVRRDSSLSRIVETVDFPGSLLAIRELASTTYIVSKDEGTLVFTEYLANNDSDGDGVPNEEDAFPLDVAASVDSDSDGYPDQWNDGYGEGDSTTELVLDAFPEDAACWLNEHDDGAGNCDYAAVVPEFIPDEIATDNSGTVYLYSAQHRTVFRWSAEEGSFQNPIFVGQSNGVATLAPTSMGYSTAHERLYFGYETGLLTYVDLNTGSGEQSFASGLDQIRSLTALGSHLLVQEGIGSGSNLNIFDVNGSPRTEDLWVSTGTEFVWNDASSRFYYLRNYSTSRIYYHEVDRSTGESTTSGYSDYYPDAQNQPPVRVVNGGSQLVLGSGAIYDASTLNLSNSAVPGGLSDAVDLGELLAVSTYSEGRWYLDLYDYRTYEPVMTFPVASKILRIFPYGEQVLVVGQVDGSVRVSSIFLGDADGDGIPGWWELRYGLSDEDSADASSDQDSDGLTNLQEYQEGTSPLQSDSDGDELSDYDEINIHLTIPTEKDTDRDGLADGDEVLVYSTDPLLSDSDSDGYSDSDELLKYETDPNDGNSVPQAISELYESFEGNSIPVIWWDAAENDADWYLVEAESYSGSKSIRSGAISHNQSSAITYSGLFNSGTLSFSARVDSESCCDSLEVYLDGERQFSLNENTWSEYQLPIEEGEHEIEWRYRKDSSVNSGQDAAWIDNIRFGL